MTERHSLVEFETMFKDNDSVPTVCRIHLSRRGTGTEPSADRRSAVCHYLKSKLTIEFNQRSLWKRSSANICPRRPRCHDAPWTLSCATVIVRANATPSALTPHATRSAAAADTP